MKQRAENKKELKNGSKIAEANMYFGSVSSK